MSVKSNVTASPEPESRPAGANPAVHRRKPRVTVRIDHEVLEWFRTMGPGYHTRISAVLRSYMEYARGDRG